MTNPILPLSQQHGHGAPASPAALQPRPRASDHTGSRKAGDEGACRRPAGQAIPLLAQSGREIAPADGALQLYLRDIAQLPLLDEAAEHALGLQIEAGRLARQSLAREPRLPAAEYQQLQQLVASAQRAAQCLVEANLRLVVSIARRYAGYRVGLMDLIQEGNLGLMHAVEKFRTDKGCRFSTYATPWIRQSIIRGLANTGRLIRLPCHAEEFLRLVHRTSKQLEQVLEAPPTLRELVQVLGCSPAKLQAILSCSGAPLSLEQPADPNDASQTIGETIASDMAGPEELALAHDAVEQAYAAMERVLQRLPARERRLLALRHGLQDQQEHTLEETGRQLGVTRERTRQLELRALRRLRALVLAEALSRLCDHGQDQLGELLAQPGWPNSQGPDQLSAAIERLPVLAEPWLCRAIVEQLEQTFGVRYDPAQLQRLLAQPQIRPGRPRHRRRRA